MSQDPTEAQRKAPPGWAVPWTAGGRAPRRSGDQCVAVPGLEGKSVQFAPERGPPACGEATPSKDPESEDSENSRIQASRLCRGSAFDPVEAPCRSSMERDRSGAGVWECPARPQHMESPGGMYQELTSRCLRKPGWRHRGHRLPAFTEGAPRERCGPSPQLEAQAGPTPMWPSAVFSLRARWQVLRSGSSAPPARGLQVLSPHPGGPALVTSMGWRVEACGGQGGPCSHEKVRY